MTVNTLGSDERTAKPRDAAWLWPLLPVAVSMFALSALVSYQLHANGGQLAQSVLQRAVVGIYSFFGFVPAFFFFLLVLSWSSIWFVTGRLEKPGARLLRLLALTLALAIWVNLQPEGSEASPAAGALGNWIGGRMVSTLGRFLSVLVVAPLALAALLLATDFFFYRFFEGVHARLDQLGPEPGEGVEPDVSEHFKGLSQVLTPHAPREPAPREPAPREPARREIGPREIGPSGPAAAAASAAVLPAVAPLALDSAAVVRRESNFERRQREARERGSVPAQPGTAASETDEPETDEPEIVEPAAVEPEVVSVVLASGPAANASPADDEFSIAAALTDAATTERPATDSPATDSPAADPPALDEPPASPSERGGVARPWGAAVVDDADTDDTDENDADENDIDETVDAEKEDEAAAAIEGLGGEAIVVLEPNADLVSSDQLSSDQLSAGQLSAGQLSSGLELPMGPDATATPAEEPAVGSRRKPVEVPGDETVDEAAGADAEPVVAIPRPAEGVRQQRLFVTTVDEALVREAVELVTSTRRASVALLQRKLQIDFEQAMEVLAVLARRGVIDLGAGETQGRVR